LRPLQTSLEIEPLFYSEWWYRLVGADRAESPGPGKPVTVVDTGIDFAHPEFHGRPETVALNTITFTDEDRGSHGTAVGSLVAAPVNGVGLVGIYPRARLLVWDGYDLSFGAVIARLAAAARNGPGVINLSLGYPAGSFGGNVAVRGAHAHDLRDAFRNGAPSAVTAFVNVKVGAGAPRATYRLGVSVAARP